MGKGCIRLVRITPIHQELDNVSKDLERGCHFRALDR